MELKTVKIEKPEEINFILGQTHFIKSVEDLHEALVTAVPRLGRDTASSSSLGRGSIRLMCSTRSK